jgi:uncharacterized membrane protein
LLERRSGQEGRDNKPKVQSVHFFELRPNCSLTSRSATLFYLSILAVCLPVAIAAALAGLWPVLPFAGLELLGVGAALKISMRRGRDREFVRIDERDVTIGRSSGSRQVEYRFARPWTRVELRTAGVPAWPSRLLVGSMGKTVEIGHFLTESERQRLTARLAELIPVRRMPDAVETATD